MARAAQRERTRWREQVWALEGQRGGSQAPFHPTVRASGALGTSVSPSEPGGRIRIECQGRDWRAGQGRAEHTPRHSPHRGPLREPRLPGHGSRAPTVNMRRFRLRGGVVSSVGTPMTLGSTEVLLETLGPPRTFPLSLWEPHTLNDLLGRSNTARSFTLFKINLSR